MSRGHPTTFEALCLAMTCERCKQPPRRWCVTRSGAWASWLHSARELPIIRAIDLGRREERMRRDVIDKRDAMARRAAD